MNYRTLYTRLLIIHVNHSCIKSVINFTLLNAVSLKYADILLHDGSRSHRSVTLCSNTHPINLRYTKALKKNLSEAMKWFIITYSIRHHMER